MSTLKIVFAGTPEFGLPCLDALHASQHEIVAIYTQPDRPAGRGQKLQMSAVKTWGQSHQLPIQQPINFKSEAAIATLEALHPDLMIVIAYGLILPKRILQIPKWGCLNVHASLLPRWRGASPIQHAILAGDNETGVTIMQMDVGMDTGPYFTMRTCPITSSDTAENLHHRLSELSPEPLLQVVNAISNQSISLTPQSTDGITYAPKINKQDAAIDWSQSAHHIDCKIRGYYPWPIAFVPFNNMQIRIHQASVVVHEGVQTPGTILALSRKGVLVKTADNAILIQKMQWPGGRVISVIDYLNAKRPEWYVGLVL